MPDGVLGAPTGVSITFVGLLSIPWLLVAVTAKFHNTPLANPVTMQVPVEPVGALQVSSIVL
jgi:hypothetical protein